MRQNGNDASPVRDLRLPLHLHVSLPDMEDDEGEGMDESQGKHGPANPPMEDDQPLTRDSSQRCDHVGFCRQDADRHKASPGQYILACDDREFHINIFKYSFFLFFFLSFFFICLFGREGGEDPRCLGLQPYHLRHEGRQAKAIQHDRVAMGGELPKLMVLVLGQ